MAIKFLTTHLWYGEGSYQVGPIWAVFTPNPDLPDGTYDLEIPDYPHVEFGDIYLSQTPYARCWFRIRKGGSNTLNTRFLHTGNVSDGCVTVKDIPYWTKIYNYLFTALRADTEDNILGELPAQRGVHPKYCPQLL